MPHAGNITTKIPGPYPPAHLGGHGATMDIGDVLQAGFSGQIRHFDHDLNFKQSIVTRQAIDPNGGAREIEVTDACWDSRGRLYVALYCPIWCGGTDCCPQIQWFDNNAVDLGRFDQNVFYSAANVFPQLFPYGICCLRDGTIAVLAAWDLSNSTPDEASIVHLGKNGELLAHYTNIDQDFGVSGMDQQSLEVGPDGYTVYYCDQIMVRRFDMRTGLNVAPIPVEVDFEGVIVLPDTGIVSVSRPASDYVISRHTVNGTLVWQKNYPTSSPEPGLPVGINNQALGLGKDSFFLYNEGLTRIADGITSDPFGTRDRIVEYSLENGEIINWRVAPAIPYDEGDSYFTASRVPLWSKPAASFGTVIGAT